MLIPDLLKRPAIYAGKCGRRLDAPGLAAASVGIAMGAQGASAATEAADVVGLRRFRTSPRRNGDGIFRV